MRIQNRAMTCLDFCIKDVDLIPQSSTNVLSMYIPYTIIKKIYVD